MTPSGWWNKKKRGWKVSDFSTEYIYMFYSEKFCELNLLWKQEKSILCEKLWKYVIINHSTIEVIPWYCRSNTILTVTVRFQLASSWQTREQVVTQYGPCIAGCIIQNDGYLSNTISTKSTIQEFGKRHPVCFNQRVEYHRPLIPSYSVVLS